MGANVYQCFAFPAPFADGEQATGWAPVIDDDRVLHHLALLRVPRTYAPGESFECFDMPAGSQVLAAWAPGAPAFELPSDAGMSLPGRGESLVLQIHYWNVPGYDDAFDRSGLALCTTTTPRPSTASYINAGTTDISIPPRSVGHEEAGGCSPSATARLSRSVTAIAAFPHMHRLGRRITTAVLPDGELAAAARIVQVDPWSFDNQGLVPLDASMRIDPGDAVVTTCVYDNPTADTVRFGERTEDEMCGTAILVYPLSSQLNCF